MVRVVSCLDKVGYSVDLSSWQAGDMLEGGRRSNLLLAIANADLNH